MVPHTHITTTYSDKVASMGIEKSPTKSDNSLLSDINEFEDEDDDGVDSCSDMEEREDEEEEQKQPKPEEDEDEPSTRKSISIRLPGTASGKREDKDKSQDGDIKGENDEEDEEDVNVEPLDPEAQEEEEEKVEDEEKTEIKNDNLTPQNKKGKAVSQPTSQDKKSTPKSTSNKKGATDKKDKPKMVLTIMPGDVPANPNPKKRKAMSLMASIPKNLEEQERLFFESGCTVNPKFEYDNPSLAAKFLASFKKPK